MNEPYQFSPPKRAGIVFHLSAIAILTLSGGWGLWQAFHASVGPAFLFYLLPFLLAVPLVPFLIYRLNNLENASYTLERDSLHLRWGLRGESIPMVNIQWVRPATDLAIVIRYPRLRWPGAVLGTRPLPGGRTLIEFMAASTRNLMVVATADRFFAISPENPSEFLQTYQHLTELGSLVPATARTTYPTALFSVLWRDRPARFLILAMSVLSLGLLIWVSLAIPARAQISLGFSATAAPRDLIPSIRLMLLPILNTLIFIVNLFLGFTFFRREPMRPLAYLLWGTGVFTTGLFLAATFFILQNP